ncbi:hypothetical protein C8R47DRAFT_1071677 [Mycena vitilis]|nr:hypothetical protein C8R47DRAFT_1071677 [Mycena vitilis]
MSYRQPVTRGHHTRFHTVTGLRITGTVFHGSRHCKNLQSDPEAAAKAREQAKVNEAKYCARHGERLAAVAKLGCMDKQYKKLGGKEYCRRQAAKDGRAMSWSGRSTKLHRRTKCVKKLRMLCGYPLDRRSTLQGRTARTLKEHLWPKVLLAYNASLQNSATGATDRLDLESAENVIPIRAMDATGHLDPHQLLATHATAGFDPDISPPMPPLVSRRVSKFCDTGISPPLPPLVSTRIRKFCDTGTPPPMPGPVIGEEGALPPLPRVHNYSLDLRRHQKIILS